MRFAARFLILSLILVGLTGCDDRTYQPGRAVNFEIVFTDEVASNVQVPPEQLALEFVDLAGKRVKLADFRGKQNVVLVFTRGFSGAICAYCSAQTSRLIAQYPEFARRNAEILVVFPGPKEQVQLFIESAQRQAREKAGAAVGRDGEVPFRLLLDPDFKAVDQLGLRDDLAKPSTFIFDKRGELRFAYVGKTISDRPSVKAMLGQLDAISAN